MRQQRDKRPVAFRGKDGNPRWHPIFDGNPRISRTFVGAQISENRSGHRPYIRSFDKRKFIWQPRYECPAGEIYFTEAERKFGALAGYGAVLIEPHVKARDGNNKDWGFTRWQAVVDSVPHLNWVQTGPPGTAPLAGVRFIETTDFRLAAAVLANARGYVGPEGGLHHAAAAVGKPAVVVFSEFISPAQTGYATHRNLYAAGEPCGSRLPCAGCRASLDAITPRMVVDAMERTL